MPSLCPGWSCIISLSACCTHMVFDLANHSAIGNGLNWMQLSLDNDSDEDCSLDCCWELTDYLESKREVQKEGLVEWWGVSLACMYPYHILLMDLNTSTIPFITPPSPTLHETILPFKDPPLRWSIHFWVVGSPGPTYTTVSRPLRSRHSRSSRVCFAMGF